MGKKPKILVDTDMLIKVYRGNAFHRVSLEKIENKLAISSVTYLELLFGLKTGNRIISLNKQIRAFQLLHISETIPKKPLKLLTNVPFSILLK